MRYSKIVAVVILFTGFAACYSPVQKWYNNLYTSAIAGDDVLNLSVEKIPLEQDTTILNYRLRLKPAENLKPDENSVVKQDLLYHMDSCFYIRANEKIVYPLACESVNSGLKNTFEYLLSFEVTPEMRNNSFQLIYHDRLFNRKKYTLQLSQN